LGWGIGRGGSFSVTKNVIEMPLRTDSTKKAYAAFPSWTRKRGAKGRLEKDERGGDREGTVFSQSLFPKSASGFKSVVEVEVLMNVGE